MMLNPIWERYGQPLNTVVFDSPSHSDSLLVGLNKLRTRGELLDITLYAQNHPFQAHRAVLASCSDYFRAMFTDAMIESTQSEIKLNGVTANGMRLLLDYAYTSKLGLNLENIQDVLSAASHIQVVAVVEACSSYLDAQLDLENCVDIVTIAETYSLNKLRNRAYIFMSGHLKEFFLSKEFYRLNAQQLEHLLSCDFPVDCGEAEILKIVICWVKKHDNIGHKKKMSHVNRLLHNIHLNELTKWEIERILQKLFSGGNRNDEHLYRHIMKEACLHVTLERDRAAHSNTHNLINSRGMEMATVKVGGFGVNGITNEITYYLRSTGRWKRLTMIPHVEQCNFGTAVLNNELYVVGGCFNQSLQEYIHPFGFRYSPRFNKWMTMVPMQRERCRFSLNAMGDQLLAVGGAAEAESGAGGENEVGSVQELATVECYDIAKDCWIQLSSLPEGRAQHGGCAWPQINPDRLIITGGLHGDTVLSSVRCYRKDIDTWEILSEMPMGRADHIALLWQDEILVCGGWYDDAAGRRALAATIDAYDVHKDRWRVITHVPTPRYHSGIVLVGQKIYIIGGFHSDATFDRATSAVECYDLERDVWTTEENYPQEVWEHACVTLYVPRYRDDMDVLPDLKDPAFL